MRPQPANSALEVEVTQRDLVWERKRKGGRFLPLDLALGLEGSGWVLLLKR